MRQLQGVYSYSPKECTSHFGLLIYNTSSTVKSIVITSSVGAIWSDSRKGVFDETVWNEESPKVVEKWKPGDEISPNVVYRASKVLAEKGLSMSELHRKRDLTSCLGA